MTVISSNSTIAKNTLLLYVRMAVTMIVSLYTSRVILSILGVVDDGIYSIVGGTVSMFLFLNGALSGATSRFLTVELAKENKDRLKKTFSAALLVHIVLSFIILLLLETVGLWLLNHKLVIPEDRMHAARVVYQLSAFATFLSITQVPYTASIISHEKMGTFAYMSILEAGLKLLICYLLLVSPIDKLITYGILILLVKVLIITIYRLYCIRSFEECRFSFVKDWEVIKPILFFSWWDLLGNMSITARDQGVDIVMNTFFGPIINSAAGKAGVVCNAINGFANNILTAVRPPIVKSYSVGNIVRMEELMIDASKYAYSLLILLSVPFFFESQFVLDLWLKNPPQYASVFCVADLVMVLIIALFRPLSFAIHATGRIRFMSIANSVIFLTSVPIAYFLLKAGKSPIAPWIAKCVLQILVAMSNLYCVKRNIREFNVGNYLINAIVPALISVAIILPITYLVFRSFTESSWLRFLSVCMTSTLAVSVTVFFIVFDKKMRNFVTNKAKSFFAHSPLAH